MNKRNISTITALLFAPILQCYAVAEERRPNIIVFLVDDLGWNDTSLPMSGEKTKYNNRYKTPYLETFAKQGTILTNAHSQALSVPSRASLITGQNSIRNGISGDYEGTVNPFNTLAIDAGTVLDPRCALPKILKQEGYKTIHCGKYHLCEYKSQIPTPEDVGFDVNIAGSLEGQPGSYLAEDNYVREGTPHAKNPMKGLEKFFGGQKHLTEALTETAIKEVNKAVNDKHPFFLYMAHYAVHTPIQPHETHIKHYPIGENENVSEAQYGSMITGVDASLGEFMKELDRLGIAENTLILFISDNGGRVLWRGKKSLYDNYEFNYPLRSGKASLYEGGIRVPAVVRWPNRVKAGAISDVPVMIEDVYSTVLEAAGVKPPANYQVDGKNLLPALQGKKPTNDLAERSMYFYLPYRFEGAHKSYNGPDFKDGGVTPSAAIIKNGWKLIYIHSDKRFELYNLNKDLGERNNLIHVEKKRAAGLVNDLDAYLKANNALNSMRLPEKKYTPWPKEAYERKNI